MTLKLKANRRVCLHHLAIGLTVCLAAVCKLLLADNSNLKQVSQISPSSSTNISNYQQNRWTPMINGTSEAPTRPQNVTAAEAIKLELDRSRECCARLLAENKARDILEAAASVMAPIERVPAPGSSRGRQSVAEAADDEQDDEDMEGSEEPQLARPTNAGWPTSGGNNQANANIVDRGGEAIDPAAAEQEAAEASEAEAADRSALDEQLQQQREIIMAQAQSEAKAIQEQQEALLRQQNLQHQMQLRQLQHRPSMQRQKSPTNNYHGQPTAAATQRQMMIERRLAIDAAGQTSAASSNSGRRMSATIDKSHPSSLSAAPLASEATSRVYHNPSINHNQADIQFSDQPDRKHTLTAPFSQSSTTNNNNNMDQQALLLTVAAGQNAKALDSFGMQSMAADELQNEAALADDESPASSTRPAVATNGDLHTAAQHHYGSHYGSVKGHHGDYYQFAESHKKGQFHSGFKRGGKKFQVSGHASQHKSHAEGHLNWHGKKGKGVQYWDYKHKNKKHHDGGGYGYH